MTDMAAATSTRSINGTASLNGATVPQTGAGTRPARRTAGPVEPVKKKRRGRGLQKAITVFVAIVAVGGSATGMWAFFGDRFHIHNVYERAALFAVFEGALLACGLAERTNRINAAERAAEREADRKKGLEVPEPERQGVSVEAIAIWVFATITGLLSASNETSWPGRAGRMALPLLAAFMVERAIHNEARDLAPRRPRINWRFGPERLFVLLGLADAEATDMADVERTRRIGQLATLRYKAETAHVFKGRARRRFNRKLSVAQERYGLASSPKLLAQFEAATALLYSGFASTAPAALTQASPWTASTIERRAAGKAAQSATTTASTTSASNAVRTSSVGNRGAVKVEPMGKPPRRSAAELLHAYFAARAENPTATNDALAGVLGLKDSTSIRQARRKMPELWAQLEASFGSQPAADATST